MSKGKSGQGRNDNGDGCIYQRKDGRYTVALYGKVTTAKDLKTANAKLKEMKLKAALNEPMTVKKTSVKNYIGQWLVSKKNSLKPASYKRLKQTYNNQVVKYIGDIQLQALRADDIQTMVNEVYENKSYSTAKKAFDCVNECMSLAVLKRQLPYNPCVGVVIPRKPKRTIEDEETRYYTQEEVHKIVEEAKRTYKNGTPVYRYGYVIILLLATGMREGEALYLKWKNVDFEKQELLVCGNVVEADHNVIEQDTPKTENSNRTIPLNNRAIEALKALKDICGNSERVICTDTGSIVYPSSIRRTMETILKRCEIVGVKSKVHALRHTFAVNLIRGGMDVKAVSQLLGHSDIDTTLKTYYHTISEQRKEAVKVIDNFF